jgi:hypothetical protein
MIDKIYVPARGKRIPMPGNQPDWPQDGQAIDPLSTLHRRMVLDGDLVLKTPDPKPNGGKK